MRGLQAGCALLLGLFLSGCTEPVDDGTDGTNGTVALGLITPGAWAVNSTGDHLLVWAQNLMAQEITVEFSVSGFNRSFLPDGWNITFEPPSVALKPKGTRVSGARGMEYPDWGWSLATIHLPSRSGNWSAQSTAVLTAGPGSLDFEIHVDDSHAKVSGPGNRVNAKYKGSFQDTGETFDSGEFPTTLGSGETVAGFDYGLMGLKIGEKARLVLPPPLGYGYDRTGQLQKFNGRTLLFDVELTSIV